MRLPAFRLAFLSGPGLERAKQDLEHRFLGTTLMLPPDLPEAEQEEICDLFAVCLRRPVHVAAKPVSLPAGHVCVVTEPVESEPAPVEDGVVIASGVIEPGRRRLGLGRPLRLLRDAVLAGIAEDLVGSRLERIAGWAQEAVDSPSTALRFVSAAQRHALGHAGATDAEVAVEGLAETIGWLLRGIDPRVAEWVLAHALAPERAGRLVSLEAALLGERAALQRALAAGLLERVVDPVVDPAHMVDVRPPFGLLSLPGDLSARVDLPMIAAALRSRVDPLAFRVLDRFLQGRPKALRLLPPLPPRVFLGRDEAVRRLATLFEPAREIRAAVLHGLGGIGKSAVAATLCARLSDRLEPVWLTFANGPEAAWQRVADALGVDTLREGWLRRVHAMMAERDALIVVDDAEGVSESALPEWLPTGAGSCAVLVLSKTSQRVFQREHDAIAVALHGLGEEDARALLANGAPAKAEAIRKGEADGLLRLLGGHPAAIRIAAGLVEKRAFAEVAALVRRGEEAIEGLVKPALAALGPEDKGVVEALAVGARTGSPHMLVARMVGGRDVGAVLREVADRGLVELGARTVRLHGIVALAVEREVGEARRRWLDLAHAEAVDTVMEAARKAWDDEELDEVYADAMLALGRMTDRCRAGERESAHAVVIMAYHLKDYPRGPRGETLSAVIAGYRAVLDVWPSKTHSEEWAEAQTNLGNALVDLPVGDRAENLRQAICAYEGALTIYTKNTTPNNWADVQYGLGRAFGALPVGDRLENAQRAIKAFEAALTVYTEDADLAERANVQNGLGVALSAFPDGDRVENQRRAIDAFQAALKIWTQQEHQHDWAMVQNNLGSTLLRLEDGNWAENLRHAIDAFQAALTVYTPRTNPAWWATVQSNIGVALLRLPDGDQSDNLRRAIKAFRAALTVQTRDAFPWDWARTQSNLGAALAQLPGGDRRENLNAAVDAYRAALTVYTADSFPTEHAASQADLDAALRELAALGPATDPPPPG